MVTDIKVLKACMAGVMICRGYSEDEAKRRAETVDQPDPHRPIVELAREIASVFLTLQAHGKMSTDA